MKCSNCSFEDTKVLESREIQDGRSIRRRRVCTRCGYRFTTYEKEEELPIQIQKKNGTFEQFNKNKLVKAMQIACTKRPVPLTKIESVVEDIEKRLKDSGERIISSKQIGDMTMCELKKLDRIAYVRFASIYKDFKDTSDFSLEVEDLGRSERENILNE